MFKRSNDPASAAVLGSERFDTLIAASTTIEGRLVVRDGIRLDGTLIGAIDMAPGSRATVAVASGAKMKGDIRAQRVLVAGEVHGNIQAIERVDLLPGAQVHGDIAYGSISIAHGAKVMGMLVEQAQATAASDRTGALLQSARNAREAPRGA